MAQITEPQISERQKQVLDLVVIGEPIKSIAIQLGISPYTAKIHIRNLCAAYNADSRYRLIALFYRAKQ